MSYVNSHISMVPVDELICEISLPGIYVLSFWFICLKHDFVSDKYCGISSALSERSVREAKVPIVSHVRSTGGWFVLGVS